MGLLPPHHLGQFHFVAGGNVVGEYRLLGVVDLQRAVLFRFGKFYVKG